MLHHQNRQMCSNCFSELDPAALACPVCGHDDRSPQPRLASALPSGTVLLGKYVIGQVLGKGGFGITYLACDLSQNRRVAIKEYLPDALIHRNTGETFVSTFSGDKETAFKDGAEKFFEEARTIARFSGHPNIINVYEFFYENNTAYFAMEYVQGSDLKRHVASSGGTLSEQECLAILEPLLDALILIHSVGVLHRDISPDNIFVSENRSVKLLDFGSARQVLWDQSKSLSVVLKPGFAPIEQYQTRGKQGPWTDIYALAATLYYCLTGRIPMAAMDRIEEDQLIAPSKLGCKISRSFEAALLKSLSLRAVNRFQTAAGLKAAVDFSSVHTTALAAAADPDAAAPNRPAKPVSWLTRSRRTAALVGVFVILSGTVSVSAWQIISNSRHVSPPTQVGQATPVPTSAAETAESTVWETTETPGSEPSAAETSQDSTRPAATTSPAVAPTTAPTAIPTHAPTTGALSTNCKLATLIIDGLDVSDCLAETSEISYWASPDQTRVDILAKAADSTAKVSIVGAGYTSDLQYGYANTLKITVTAQSGAKNIYTVTIARDTPATATPTPDPAKNYFESDPQNSGNNLCFSAYHMAYSNGGLTVNFVVYNNYPTAIKSVELKKLGVKDSSGNIIARFEGYYELAASIEAGQSLSCSYTFTGSELTQDQAWLPDAYVSESSVSHSY